MAIQWGGYDGPTNNRFRVGIDVSISGGRIRVQYLAQCTASVNDNMTLHRTGGITGNVAFQMVKGSSGGTHTITTSWINNPVPGQTYSFGASLSGIYNGAAPAKSPVSIAAPPGTPSAPSSVTVNAVTATSATCTFNGTISDGGSPVTAHQFQFARDSAFTQELFAPQFTGGRQYTQQGFSRVTQYWVRARVRNAINWGPWSPGRSFTTRPQVPTMGNTSSAANVTRHAADIVGSSVSDNGGESPTNLRVQYNTTSSATGATVYDRGSWAVGLLRNLTAGTTYFYRVAAWNSAGWSSYSPWRTFQTLALATTFPDDMATPTISGVSDTGLTAMWTQPELNGATLSYYRYRLATDENFANTIRSGVATGLTMTFSGLQPGTQYYFGVQAATVPGDGAWGEAKTTTTGAPPSGGNTLRVYTFIGGQRRQLEPYTFVNGVRRSLRVAYQHNGIMETN